MDEGGDYRPVSRLAVGAAVAGALSALALVNPICRVIPLVAIGLAVAALFDVNRPGARKAGGWAAVVGLALAVGFGTQAVTSAVVSRWLVERRAAAVARHWIDAVRAGRLADAISVSAMPPAGPLQVRSAAAAEQDREAAFATLPAVRGLRACGREPPRVTAIELAAETEAGWIVVASLAPCGRPEESLRLVVEPSRVQRQGGAVERWMVTGFTLER
jgi:hypothetical protein